MDKFFEFLRIAVGNKAAFDEAPTGKEWEEIAKCISRQGLSSVAFQNLEKLPEEQRPAEKIILGLYGAATVIERKNAKYLRLCQELTGKFSDDGFRCCILKGEGTALNYPEPLRRQCSDIDIWMDGDLKAVEPYVRQNFKETEPPTTYHIGAVTDSGALIECHFRPHVLHNSHSDKKLQAYFSSVKDREFANVVTYHPSEIGKELGLRENISFPASTVPFNLVFMPVHMLSHYYGSGFSLRQVMDYYYTLLQPCSERDVREDLDVLDSLHVTKFLRGLMWLLQYSFGMDESKLIAEPDGKVGRLLLEHVMKGSDSWLGKNLYRHSRPVRALIRAGHHLSKFNVCPSESLAGPLFDLKNYFWRRKHK
jgi:hypothetical protein